jgi:nucleolar protein 58
MFSPCFCISALLDDLDKELNNYIMRAREWYGWHFPELTKLIGDNLAYAKTVKKMGNLIFKIT